MNGIKRANMCEYSYPFDWLWTPSKTTFNILNILINDSIENTIEYMTSGFSYYNYINNENYTSVNYNTDYQMNKDSGLGITHFTINNEYKNKLRQRLERLLNDIKSNNNLLFLYADAANPDLNYHLDEIEYGVDATDYLLKIYTLIFPLNNNIKIVYFCWIERYKNNGIIEYISYDFKNNWMEISEIIKNYLLNLNYKECNTMKNKNCICLICYKPNDIWIDFLSQFIEYDIYIMIDDNSKDYKEQYFKFNNINIIQINDEECINNGFVNMNNIFIKKLTSWDKSMYYFSTINTIYNNVWFFEDDVFFYNEQTLINIDSKYPKLDLLSNYYTENITGEKNDWHWSLIDINFKPPYYYAMVCCVRISTNLLSKIKDYANEYNTLFFLEALFPTICKKYNLLYDTPYEFKEIYYRTFFEDKNFNKNNFYHPVKDITKHIYYRNMLKNYKINNSTKYLLINKYFSKKLKVHNR
jgi:hypothetical protein